jgi:hypothetical protein
MATAAPTTLTVLCIHPQSYLDYRTVDYLRLEFSSLTLAGTFLADDV